MVRSSPSPDVPHLVLKESSGSPQSEQPQDILSLTAKEREDSFIIDMRKRKREQRSEPIKGQIFKDVEGGPLSASVVEMQLDA